MEEAGEVVRNHEVGTGISSVVARGRSRNREGPVGVDTRVTIDGGDTARSSSSKGVRIGRNPREEVILTRAKW